MEHLARIRKSSSSEEKLSLYRTRPLDVVGISDNSNLNRTNPKILLDLLRGKGILSEDETVLEKNNTQTVLGYGRSSFSNLEFEYSNVIFCLSMFF